MHAEQILSTWISLHTVILTLTEEQVWDLLAYELAHQKRRIFVRRLFGRANKLRVTRELKAALKETK